MCWYERRGPRPRPAADESAHAVSRPRVKMHESWPRHRKKNERVVWLQRGGRRARQVQGEIVGTGGPSLGDACCDGPGEAVEIWGDPGGVDDASIATSGTSRRSAAN